jgi:hypothetical protein
VRGGHGGEAEDTEKSDLLQRLREHGVPDENIGLAATAEIAANRRTEPEMRPLDAENRGDPDEKNKICGHGGDAADQLTPFKI